MPKYKVDDAATCQCGWVPKDAKAPQTIDPKQWKPDDVSKCKHCHTLIQLMDERWLHMSIVSHMQSQHEAEPENPDCTTCNSKDWCINYKPGASCHLYCHEAICQGTMTVDGHLPVPPTADTTRVYTNGDVAVCLTCGVKIVMAASRWWHVRHTLDSEQLPEVRDAIVKADAEEAKRLHGNCAFFMSDKTGPEGTCFWRETEGMPARMDGRNAACVNWGPREARNCFWKKGGFSDE